MKRIFLTCVFSLFATVFAFAGGKMQGQKADWLFVMSADHAVVSQSSGKTYLTLSGINPSVLGFTDRPVRKAKFFSANHFFSRWIRTFGNDAPNASLVHADMSAKYDGEIEPFAFELSSPKKLQKGVWRFQMKALKGDALPNGDLQAVHIFLDDVGCEVCYCQLACHISE